MAAQKNDILQGTLVLLVLKTLASNRRMHGYAITVHIQHSRPTCSGSKKDRSIPRSIAWSSRAGSGRNGASPRGIARRVSTRSRAKGRKQLAQEEKSWAKLTEGVARVLRFV